MLRNDRSADFRQMSALYAARGPPRVDYSRLPSLEQERDLSPILRADKKMCVTKKTPKNVVSDDQAPGKTVRPFDIEPPKIPLDVVRNDQGVEEEKKAAPQSQQNIKVVTLKPRPQSMLAALLDSG